MFKPEYIDQIKQKMKKQRQKKIDAIRYLKNIDKIKYYQVIFYSLLLNHSDKVSTYYNYFKDNQIFLEASLNISKPNFSLDTSIKKLLVKNPKIIEKLLKEEIELIDYELPLIYPILVENNKVDIVFSFEKDQKSFFVYYPAMYGITGYNGVGKSYFCLFLLQNANLKKEEKLYIINEDNIMIKKLKLKNLNFEVIRVMDYNQKLVNYISRYKMVVIDSFPSFFTATETNAMDRALKELYFLANDRTIILINHQLKTIKTNNVLTDKKNKQASIYGSYGAFYANYIDVGLSISKTRELKFAKEVEITEISVEKDRIGLMKDLKMRIEDIKNVIKTDDFISELFIEEFSENGSNEILEEDFFDEEEDEYGEYEEE